MQSTPCLGLLRSRAQHLLPPSLSFFLSFLLSFSILYHVFSNFKFDTRTSRTSRTTRTIRTIRRRGEEEVPTEAGVVQRGGWTRAEWPRAQIQVDLELATRGSLLRSWCLRRASELGSIGRVGSDIGSGTVCPVSSKATTESLASMNERTNERTNLKE